MGIPRKRKGSGLFKEEETNIFFSTLLSLSHIKHFVFLFFFVFFLFFSFKPRSDDYTTNNSV